MIEVTAEVVRDLLDYNPETGTFTWKFRDRKYCETDHEQVMVNIQREGNSAGSVYSNGYRYIIIGKKKYLAHRLAWLHYYGEWPQNHIDHINHQTDDNRIENLRDATRSQNQGNERKGVGTSSSYKGVTWFKRDQKWKAQLTINGKNKHLGYFMVEEDAARAYDRAALEHFGNYANLNFPIEDYFDYIQELAA